MAKFTHYVVAHGNGWSRLVGLCSMKNGGILETAFGEGPIVDYRGVDEDKEPVLLSDFDFSKTTDTPVNRYGEYFQVLPIQHALDMVEDMGANAYHTDREAVEAYENA